MERILPKLVLESFSLTPGRKGEGWRWRSEGTCRKESEFDIRNNIDIITVTYNFVGDGASNATYLLSDTVIVSLPYQTAVCLDEPSCFINRGNYYLRCCGATVHGIPSPRALPCMLQKNLLVR